MPDRPPADLHASALALLRDWQPPSPEQAALREEYVDHLDRHRDGLWRHGPPAHLTASCFVLDPGLDHVLLCLHRKGGFWVQFGGHLEPGDPTLPAAALREAEEESGLARLTLLAPGPVDLDRPALSAAFGRCTEHLDAAFAATADQAAATSVSPESDDVAWWPVHALPSGVVPDLPGRLGALVSRLGR